MEPQLNACTGLPKGSLDSEVVLFLRFINQSINQTSIMPISPAKPGSVAWQPNQCSPAKSRKQFCNINRPWGVTVSMGKRPNQRDVFRCFLKVATETAERTDSGRLFQRDGAREWKALAPVLVLTLGTNKLLSLISVNVKESMRQAWNEDKQAVFHVGFCRSTNWS